jgi:hypothetical protein
VVETLPRQHSGDSFGPHKTVDDSARRYGHCARQPEMVYDNEVTPHRI